MDEIGYPLNRLKPPQVVCSCSFVFVVVFFVTLLVSVSVLSLPLVGIKYKVQLRSLPDSCCKRVSDVRALCGLSIFVFICFPFMSWEPGLCSFRLLNFFSCYIMNIEDITRVVISYEIYQTSLRRV